MSVKPTAPSKTSAETTGRLSPARRLCPISGHFNDSRQRLSNTCSHCRMPKPNLSSMSVDALLKLRDDIGEVLTRRAVQLRDELSKLGGGERRSSIKGRRVPVKFRDRSGNTWAGRGAQPVWLREKLKAGAKLEDFAVQKTGASRKTSPRKSKKRRRAKR
jgi:DNA-binding protein H-NS